MVSLVVHSYRAEKHEGENNHIVLMKYLSCQVYMTWLWQHCLGRDSAWLGSNMDIIDPSIHSHLLLLPSFLINHL